MDNNFKIDFLELMFLAESVIPPNPIARSMCFDSFSDVHYHQMTNGQRQQFFEHVKKQYSFTLENEQCAHFYARFNPKNLFLVKCFHNGKADEIVCYLHEGKLKTSKNRYVNFNYVKRVIRIFDKKDFTKSLHID